jgi:hypothetical protein
MHLTLKKEATKPVTPELPAAAGEVRGATGIERNEV